MGPSDGVQARITGTRLPDGLRVDLVDPDGGTPRARTANTAAAATATAAGVPAITSRPEWGADELLVADPPTYTTDTKAVFVHHRAGTNDYTCAESASVIRGILTYHVKSNGWNDIGYNFFVDKCGTLFEGRAGGIDRPVYGAHTYGFNTEFALFKGHRYATIIIDADNGQRVEVLPDRKMATVTAWLREHPGIRVVCRDGSGGFAQATTDAAPTIVQISDRWHFWHGLTQAALKEVGGHASCWGKFGPPLPEGKRATTTRERWKQVHDLLD
ncbi:transposase [Streptomyces sp. NPDC050421]|uniref:transposase n=1 Tax=unclassified Streptomyces TaxID=2593676 RepID=UPI0037A128D5